MELIDEIVIELRKQPPEVVLMLAAVLLHVHSQWNWKELINELKQIPDQVRDDN